jgi:hypothetical protein
MRTKIFELSNKLLCEWDSDAKVVIDTWTTYNVSLAEFKEAVLVKGVNYAKACGVIAWIVDSSRAKGVFSQEIQRFIETDIFPTFTKIGVRYFITINSESALTNMTISQYRAKAGSNGLNLLNATNTQSAIEWLMKNAYNRVY